ncbi:MAG: hypothetical protein IJU98_06365 [Synergistaceae bacterium]|nr:hypothetical protein [Synergistaceae bacterium]
MGVILVSPGNDGSSGNNHSHDNMAVLNALAVDGNNHLRLNGNLVGEEAVEVTLNVALTAQDIAARYIELPSDCDTSRALSLILENLPLNRDVDWEVLSRDWPEKDRIAWAGLGMESLAQAGDKVSINYYVKR